MLAVVVQHSCILGHYVSSRVVAESYELCMSKRCDYYSDSEAISKTQGSNIQFHGMACNLPNQAMLG